MTSVVEKIKAAQRQNEINAQIAANNQRLQEQAERTRQANNEAERIRRENARQKFVREMNNWIFHESGVLHGLQDIEAQLLQGNVAKHNIIQDIQSGSLTLVWGNRYTIEDGRIGSEDIGFIFKNQVSDYSTIGVGVNPDSQDIVVSGINSTVIHGEQWKQDKTLVEDALMHAYLSPGRCTYDSRDTSRYSSGDSSSFNSECCNS